MTTDAAVALVLQEGPPQGAPATESPGFGPMWLPLIAIFAIFWFVMIGPERKQRRKREAMLAAIQKGDKVVTTSGIHATVAAVQDDVVTLQIADGVRVRFTRAAIASVASEGAPAEEPAKKA